MSYVPQDIADEQRTFEVSLRCKSGWLICADLMILEAGESLSQEVWRIEEYEGRLCRLTLV